MESSVYDLNQRVVNCKKCPRLIGDISEVATVKIKRFRHETYWGKPVPGFGDFNPKVLLLGLAPAAHGANRTGRMFTGDSSGDWLTKALYETGFANQRTSENLKDGLKLNEIYLSASARCAPPKNKPTKFEIENCRSFLMEELELFRNVEIILALGAIAFKNVLATLNLKGLPFGHNKLFQLDEKRALLSSYHPSRQNTQTGRLLWSNWLAIFQRVRKYIDASK